MVLPPTGGGENLGEAYARIRIDASGVQAGIQQAQNVLRTGLQNMGQSVQNMGQQMSSMGQQVTLAMAPLTAFGATGLRTAANFDEAMTAISARTGLVGESLQEVQDIALQLGADTAFSSQQAADAFLQLLTAGLDVEQAMAAIPNVLDAAAASGEDLGRSADLVTNIMSSFRLEADQTGQIVEALSRAAASSPSSMGQIGEAMQVVGGLATGMGIEMNETAAIMAIFAQNGIRGAEAGTALRSMLLNMNRQTEDVAEAWAELGTSMFDSEGNARDLNVVFQELDAALSTRSAEEQNRLITTLAGSYGLAGFNALRAGVTIEEMQEIMAGQASASDVAAARMQSFKGVIDSLMGSVETLQIAAFTPFMNNVLRPLGAMLIERVNQVTAWVQANPELTQTIVAVMAAVSSLAAVMIPLGIVISTAGAGLATIASRLSFLLSPIGLVVGGLYLLYRAWQTNTFHIRDMLEPVLNRVRTVLDILSGAFQLFQARMRAGVSVFGTIATILSYYTDNLLVAIGFNNEFARSVRDGLVSALTAIYPIFNNIVNGVQRTIRTIRFFFSDIQDFGLEEALRGIFGTGTIADTMESSLEGVLVSFGVSRDRAISIVQSLWNTLVRTGDVFASAFSAVQPVIERVGEALTFLRIGMSSTFSFIRNGLGVFDALRLGLGQFVSNMLVSLGVSQRVANALESAFVSSINAIQSAFNGLPGALASARSGLVAVFSTILTIARDTIDGITVIFTGDFVGGMFGGAYEDSPIVAFWFNIRETILRIVNALEPPIRSFVTFMSNIFSSIDGSQLQRIAATVFEVGSIILSLTNPLGIVMNVLRFFGVNFMEVFEGVAGGVTTFFDTLNSGGGLGDAISAVFGGGGGASSGITDFFNGIVTFVTDTVIPGLNQFRDWFLIEAMPAIISFVQTTAVPMIGQFFTFLGGVWDVVAPALVNLANWFMVDGLPSIVEFITGTIVPTVQTFIGILLSIWDTVAPSLTALAGWFITDVLPLAVQTINGVFVPAIQFLTQVISDIWTMVGPSLGALFNWFVNEALPEITNFLSSTVVPAITTFIGILNRIWTDVQPFIAQLFDWFINTGLPIIVGFIEQTAVPAVKLIISTLESIWTTVSPVLSSLYDWFITTGLPAITGFIEGTATDVINSFVDTISGIWAAIEPGLIRFRDGFDTVFSFLADNVVQPVIDLVNSIVGVAEEVAGRVEDVIGGISSAVNDVGNFISDPFGAIGGALGFADGGRPPVGIPSIVGEEGPELFVPDRAGTIVPNHALADMGSTTNNHFNISVVVPDAILRDTPNLDENADRFARKLKEEFTRWGDG